MARLAPPTVYFEVYVSGIGLDLLHRAAEQLRREQADREGEGTIRSCAKALVVKALADEIELYLWELEEGNKKP